MEAVLRGEKPTEMIPFDLAAGVVYYPIRHHSPVCAWHLESVLRRYQPDCILVEGPENANDLLPLLTSPDTQAPVALYYACRDDGKLLSEAPVTYRCYYPFLDTSPELVALRYAAEQNIPGKFIDLSYGAMLLATQEARGLRTLEERQSYANDRYLAGNRFQQRLCERAGVRDFEEFWEKYFEAEGFGLTDEAFVKLMNTYCLLSRQETPAVELAEDGCLAREAHMAAQLRAAQKQYGKILVVAGGFHLWGLLHPQCPDPGSRVPAQLQQSVYPMRYDLPAADALNGYASGMPAPGFYDGLWRRLHGEHPENAWEESILDNLVRTGNRLRKLADDLSAHDERCAYELALGLAALREKRSPGLYELQDGVLAAFVKGEASLSALEPLRILRELTTGKRVGTLAAGAAVPPISRDFESRCRQFRLRPEGKKNTVLSILSDEKHRQLSRFFHQTVFLNCGFAQRKRGPDLLQNKDRNLIRETWDYRWTPQVDSSLIEYALAGATVPEAAATELRRRMALCQYASDGSGLLLQGLLMGISDHSDFLKEKLEELLLHDGNFSSLAECCRNLHLLHQWQGQYGEMGTVDSTALLGRCFDRVVLLLPSLSTVDEGSVPQVQEACMLLYELTLQPEFAGRRERFREALEMLVSEHGIHPALHGAALGLLYGMEPGWKTAIDRVARGYLQGTPGMKAKAASFLQGLFRTARDLLLTDGEFLRHIDILLGELEEAEFLQALPELRLAFSYFLPTQTDRIARQVAALYGTEAKTVQAMGIHPADYRRAEGVDAWAAKYLDTLEGVEHR